MDAAGIVYTFSWLFRWIFIFCIVCIFVDSGRMHSSTRLSRPLQIQSMKESLQVVLEMKDKIEEEIRNSTTYIYNHQREMLSIVIKGVTYPFWKRSQWRMLKIWNIWFVRMGRISWREVWFIQFMRIVPVFISGKQ